MWLKAPGGNWKFNKSVGDNYTFELKWLLNSVNYQLTDSQINDLLRVKQRWLGLNKINIRPVSTVKLTDNEVDSLIAWQKKGIEINTREELFNMLWWYSEEGELVLLANRLNIEEFLNNYFAENWIVTDNFDDYVDWNRDQDQDESAWYEFYDRTYHWVDNLLTDLDRWVEFDEDYKNWFIKMWKSCYHESRDYLLSREDCPKSLLDLIDTIRVVDMHDPYVQLLKCDEDLCQDNFLVVDDLLRKYSFSDLINLFFYLKLTNKKVRDINTIYGLINELPKVDLRTFKSFNGKSFSLSTYGLSELTKNIESYVVLEWIKWFLTRIDGVYSKKIEKEENNKYDWNVWSENWGTNLVENFDYDFNFFKWLASFCDSYWKDEFFKNSDDVTSFLINFYKFRCYYFPDLNLNDDYVKGSLCRLDSRMFNERIIKFIFDVLLKNSDDSIPISRFNDFIHVNEYVDTLSVVASSNDNLSDSDDVNFFSFLSEYFPSIDFDDPEIFKKLVKCDAKVFDKKNIDFIVKYLIPKDCENPFEEFIFKFNNRINAVNCLRLLVDHFPDVNPENPEILRKLKKCDDKMFDEKNVDFIVKYLIKKDCENPFEEFIKYDSNVAKIDSFRDFFDSGVDESWDSSLFVLLNKYFPGVDFADPKILEKLIVCDTRMFDEKNIKFIVKYLIKKDCKNPFGEFINYNSDRIDFVDKFKIVDSKLLDLLGERFWIRWDILLSLFGYSKSKKDKKSGCVSIWSNSDDFDLFYERLSRVVALFDEKYCVDWNLFDFSVFWWWVSELIELSNLENNYDILLFVNDYVNNLNMNSLVKARNYDKQMRDDLSKSFDRHAPFNEPDLKFTGVEKDEFDELSRKIAQKNSEIDYLKGIVEMLLKGVWDYENSVRKIEDGARSRAILEKTRLNVENEKEMKEKRLSCKDFFDNWITVDNFMAIFDIYFDIVFDGKDNEFLQSIPKEITMREDFLFSVVEKSLSEKSPHRIFPLFWFLNDFAKQGDFAPLDYVCMLMSIGWYFGSFISWMKDFRGGVWFAHILSKYSDVSSEEKVKLLPYIKDIPFGSKEDLDDFLSSIEMYEYNTVKTQINAEYIDLWCTFVKWHFREIMKLYQKFDKNYLVWSYKFGQVREYERVFDRLLLPDIDIFKIYSKWTWELLVEDWDIDFQKFILCARVRDPRNVDFCLSTGKVEYHEDLNYYWKIVWWWYLCKDDLNKIIYFFGYSGDFWSVEFKFYPIIIDILKKWFPDYEIKVWNPDYHD